MTDTRAVATKVSRAIWMGLFLSLFSMVVVRYALVFFVEEVTFGWTILKEVLIWVSAGGVLVIVRHGERLPLDRSASARRAGANQFFGDWRLHSCRE